MFNNINKIYIYNNSPNKTLENAVKLHRKIKLYVNQNVIPTKYLLSNYLRMNPSTSEEIEITNMENYLFDFCKENCINFSIVQINRKRKYDRKSNYRVFNSNFEK